MIKRIWAIGLMAFTAWKWETQRRERHRLQKQAAVKDKPKDVTTWEGEGGALPVTGSQLGPNPQLPTETAAR